MSKRSRTEPPKIDAASCMISIPEPPGPPGLVSSTPTRRPRAGSRARLQRIRRPFGWANGRVGPRASCTRACRTGATPAAGALRSRCGRARREHTTGDRHEQCDAHRPRPGSPSIHQRTLRAGREASGAESHTLAPVFRLSARADPAFLAEMLYEAVNWRDDGAEERPPLDEMLAQPELRRYVEGWGRVGDVAIVALDRRDEPVGGAWYRLFKRRTSPATDSSTGDARALDRAVSGVPAPARRRPVARHAPPTGAVRWPRDDEPERGAGEPGPSGYTPGTVRRLSPKATFDSFTMVVNLA